MEFVDGYLFQLRSKRYRTPFIESGEASCAYLQVTRRGENSPTSSISGIGVIGGEIDGLYEGGSPQIPVNAEQSAAFYRKVQADSSWVSYRQETQ
jgi:hypothetical protein